VFVKQPYLELHSGPGRGYPVFHVVARDESVDVLFRRTDWFKVRTERGVQGWATQWDMRQTVLADGSPFTFNVGDRSVSPRTAGAGVFAGSTAAPRWSRLRLVFAQLAARRRVVGRAVPRKFSNGVVGDVGLCTCSCPSAGWSPFLMLGTG